MAWRFRKSFIPFKGLRINLGKRGLGASIGVKGLRVGIGSRGAYTSASIPGTGLSTINYLSQGKQGTAGAAESSSASPSVTCGQVASGCAVVALVMFVLVVIMAALGSPANKARKTEVAEEPVAEEIHTEAPTVPAAAVAESKPILDEGQFYRCRTRIKFLSTKGSDTLGSFVIPEGGYFECISFDSEPGGHFWYKTRSWDTSGATYIAWIDGSTIAEYSVQAIDPPQPVEADSAPVSSQPPIIGPRRNTGPPTQSLTSESLAQTRLVYVTRSGKKFHRANCQYLKGSSSQVALSAAIGQGYTACEKCNP